MAVTLGDLVFIKREYMVKDGTIKEVNAIYWVINSAVKCKIAFVSKALTFNGCLDDIERQYADVTELYAMS